MNNQPEEIQAFIQQQIQARVAAAEQELQRRLAATELEHQARLNERLAASEREVLQRQTASRHIVHPGTYSASPKEDVEQWLYYYYYYYYSVKPAFVAQNDVRSWQARGW